MEKDRKFCHITMVRKEWNHNQLQNIFGKNLDFWHWRDLSLNEFLSLEKEQQLFEEEFELKMGYTQRHDEMYSQDILNLAYVEFLISVFHISTTEELVQFFVRDASWKNFILLHKKDCERIIDLYKPLESLAYYQKKYAAIRRTYLFFLCLLLLTLICICKDIIKYS